MENEVRRFREIMVMIVSLQITIVGAALNYLPLLAIGVIVTFWVAGYEFDRWWNNA